MYFLIHGFRSAAAELSEKPLKVASGNYTESLRVERPQHDLVTDMVLELSRLPRYTAYAKFVEETNNIQFTRTHKIHTLPLPPVKNPNAEAQAVANGHTLCLERDHIEAEIRERQNRWGRGGSPPPQTRRVR